MKGTKRNNNGITLIALVITIIVLIILAGVTIGAVMGENGIIENAKKAKQNMTNASGEENKQLQNLTNEMNELLEGENGENGGNEGETPKGTIDFGDVTWNNGQAEVSIITDNTKDLLQYQVNGTEDGSWKELKSGDKVTNLYHNDEVNARLWNGNSSEIKKKKIEDTNVPEVQISVTNVTTNSISVSVVASDKESGLSDTDTYAYYKNGAFVTASTNNSYVYNNLSESTPYTLEVKVQDKAGNEGKADISQRTNSTPTIDNTVKEGDYVYYTDSTGTEQKCIVLYGPSSQYGIQIITETALGRFALGSKDFNVSINEYNDAIMMLNNEAETYRNKSNGIASKARCVGSVPNNPNSESGYYSDPGNWVSGRGKFKDIDYNYNTDYNQMQRLGIVDGVPKYWLASRYLYKNGGDHTFGIRVVNFSGSASEECELVQINSNGGIKSQGYLNNCIRPVFTLNRGLKIVGGNGSSSSPYKLSR